MSSKINEITRKVADAAKAASTRDGQTVTSPKDLYVPLAKIVDPDITEQDLARVAAINSAITAGYTQAIAEIGEEATAADQTLDRVVGKLQMGKDRLSVTVLREETRPDPQNPGQTITRYGVVKPNLVTYAGRGDVGEMAIVRKESQSRYRALLGKLAD